jgi:hypothetical protein
MRLVCEKQAKRREHRTEVTEVTEGDLRLVAKGLRVNSGAFVRETGETKRALHRGRRGGILRLVKGLCGEQWGLPVRE